MKPRVPERHKKAGVCYAVSDDGVELPVIDVTHPAFEADFTPPELGRIGEDSVRALTQAARMPRILQWLASRRSVLIRGTLHASDAPVGGLTTYLMALGPENLGRGWATSLDRRVAAGISPVAVRLRVRELARALVDGLGPALEARPAARLQLLSLGGGVAIECLNALLLLHDESPQWLARRLVVVHSLDLDGAAPRFGARALEALRAGGGPLGGVSVSYEYAPYDWGDAASLSVVLARVSAGDSIVAGAAAGSLLEYAPDAAIDANLRALRAETPRDFFLVGSVLRDEPVPRAIQRLGIRSWRPAGLGALERIAKGAGWIVSAGGSNPMFHIVTLTKA